MGNVYEFNGEMFENTGTFLDAVAHEYADGDKQAALDALNDYGFDLSDINVRP